MGFKIKWSSLMKGWRMEMWDQTTKGGAQERGRCSMRGNGNRCCRSTGVNTDTGLKAMGIGTTDNRSGLRQLWLVELILDQAALLPENEEEDI
jgi:hypothetical protein